MGFRTRLRRATRAALAAWNEDHDAEPVQRADRLTLDPPDIAPIHEKIATSARTYEQQRLANELATEILVIRSKARLD